MLKLWTVCWIVGQKEKKAIEKETAREVVYTLVVFAWNSMMDPRGENVLNAHSPEFSGFINMHTG